MAIAVRGGDWIRAAAGEKAAAIAARGTVSGSGVTAPATGSSIALATYQAWNGAAPGIVAAAIAEGKPVSVLGMSRLESSSPGAELFFSTAPRRAAQASEGETSRNFARIDASLRTMLDAMARGFPGTVARDGGPVMDPVHASRYWESVLTLGRSYSALAARTSIDFEEKLAAFGDGASDGLSNVGEFAGQALAAAGKAAGAAAGGFFDGLGLGNVVILGAGAWAATKVF